MSRNSIVKTGFRNLSGLEKFVLILFETKEWFRNRVLTRYSKIWERNDELKANNLKLRK